MSAVWGSFLALLPWANAIEYDSVIPLDSGDLKVPTSCVGLPDGEHILKLLDSDDYPLVLTTCSNEFMLVDISKDPSWKDYFTSFDQWHYDIGGPAKNDRVNYNEWFIPAPEDPEVGEYVPREIPTKQEIANYKKPTKWLISPGCDVCDKDDTYHQQYGDKTAYHMNAAAYGLFFGVRRPACDFDWDSLQCKTCEHTPDGNMIGLDRSYELSFEDKAIQRKMIGVCLTEVRNAYSFVIRDWEDWTGYGSFTYKPSIGLAGRFCQCIKIKQSETTYTKVSHEAYENKLVELNVFKAGREAQEREKKEAEETEVDLDAEENTYYLTNEDFVTGTFRIQESGTYILKEDIVLNFNKPDVDYETMDDIDSPNDPIYDWWWPPSDDADVLLKYPGSGYKAREQYMLGYFAGITVECKDVTIDLNGHTIGMAKEFFYQQPFFAIIELMSQPFLPNQGPGFFGADPKFAENVVIKNGVIGLSSHHGIHGTKNKNVRIQDVHVRDFQTHGIQINGWEGLHLENVEVGPTTDIAFLNHNYAHIRMLLPYLYKMANFDDKHRNMRISFDPTLRSDDGKEYTMNDLIDIVVPKIDKVFKYVMSPDFDIDEYQNMMDDEDFEMFGNPDGLPYGGVLYGVYLNYPGSGIFGWDVSDLRSTDLYVKNLKVHDLKHHGKEVFGLSKNKKRFVVNTLLAPLNLLHMFGDKDVIKEWVYNSYNTDEGKITQPKYKGSICTDIYLAMYKFGSDHFDEWWMGTPYLGLNNGRLLDWAEGKDDQAMSSFKFGGDFWEPVCAVDGMVHPGKGLIAVKLTNIDNAVFDGEIEVYNLEDSTALAEEDICITRANGGALTIAKVVGSQQPPYQAEYSMNQILGISSELSDVTLADGAKIKVYNVKSQTGRVLGIASWFSSTFATQGKAHIEINDLLAGIEVKKNRFDYDSMPNHKSEACSFVVFSGQSPGDVTALEVEENVNIKQYCVHGNTGCLGKDYVYTDLKEVDNDASCQFDDNQEIVDNDDNLEEEEEEIKQAQEQQDDEEYSRVRKDGMRKKNNMKNRNKKNKDDEELMVSGNDIVSSHSRGLWNGITQYGLSVAIVSMLVFVFVIVKCVSHHRSSFKYTPIH